MYGTVVVSNLTGAANFTAMSNGSMSPSISEGSLVITKRTPISEVSEGDIILSRSGQENRADSISRVNSIVLSETTPGLYEYTMKNDRNLLPDPWVQKSSDDVYKEAYTIPAAGYILTALNGPAGYISFMLLLGLLVFVYLKVLHAPIRPETKIARWEEREEAWQRVFGDLGTVDDLLDIMVETEDERSISERKAKEKADRRRKVKV